MENAFEKSELKKNGRWFGKGSDMSLEESMKYYETGISLVRRLEDKLKSMERGENHGRRHYQRTEAHGRS